MYDSKFSSRVKALRTAKGLKLREVSEATGLHISTIANYENSQKPPSLDGLIALARFYEVGTDYLLGLDDMRPIFDNNDEIKICMKIKDLREKMHYTQSEFSVLVNIPLKIYEALEEGVLPDKETLLRMSMQIKLSLEELTGLDDEAIDEIYNYRKAVEFTRDKRNLKYVMAAMKLEEQGLNPDNIIIGIKL